MLDDGFTFFFMWMKIRFLTSLNLLFAKQGWDYAESVHAANRFGLRMRRSPIVEERRGRLMRLSPESYLGVVVQITDFVTRWAE